jgi:4-hydroxythreonine-4-phosphate dehydrogenase
MKPKIGITIGDPAGIGPEIAVKLLLKEDVNSICVPVLIGSKAVIEDIKRMLKTDFHINCIHHVSDCMKRKGIINLINLDNVKNKIIKYGKVVPKYGKAAGEYIAKGITLALKGEIDALVTNPIHKASFKLGGYGRKYAGHTEMLADLTGTKKYTMMLAHGNLRVVHVSTHVSLSRAIAAIKKERILEVIKIARDACLALGIKKPRIAVAGLNPHSGEGGLFGEEEIREILPAIRKARKSGMHLTGPVPPDSVFPKAFGGFFDIVVAMYHDQGHIPVKLLGFRWNENTRSWGKISGINVTLGLPIIRTSVDHGTAFGKAGKGIADYSSLFEALQYAVKMAKYKKEHKIHGNRR